MVVDAKNRWSGVPLDRQALLVLVAAAVSPMLPFFASSIWLSDILGDLMAFMV